jgi:hypothetical protein
MAESEFVMFDSGCKSCDLRGGVVSVRSLQSAQALLFH